jgi:hypothetical protein
MTVYAGIEKKLVTLGFAAGIAAVTMYATRTFLPLPHFLGVGFFIFFGPMLVVAFVGFHPFIARPRPSIPALLATVFGIIAGATNMMFAVVQLNNLHTIRGFMRAAEGEAQLEIWRNILSGVFTVQNGLNYVMDFFLDWTAFMYAIVMWSHPKFGKVFSILSVLAVGPHFVMKLITFPEPPAEAGLFDAGPLVAVWFAIVLIQAGRNLKWMDGKERAAVPDDA